MGFIIQYVISIHLPVLISYFKFENSQICGNLGSSWAWRTVSFFLSLTFSTSFSKWFCFLKVEYMTLNTSTTYASSSLFFLNMVWRPMFPCTTMSGRVIAEVAEPPPGHWKLWALIFTLLKIQVLRGFKGREVEGTMKLKRVCGPLDTKNWPLRPWSISIFTLPSLATPTHLVY